MNQLPDQRADVRQTHAEACLLAAHRRRAINLKVALAMIVGRQLAQEAAEERHAQA